MQALIRCYMNTGLDMAESLYNLRSTIRRDKNWWSIVKSALRERERERERKRKYLRFYRIKRNASIDETPGRRSVEETERSINFFHARNTKRLTYNRIQRLKTGGRLQPTGKRVELIKRHLSLLRNRSPADGSPLDLGAITEFSAIEDLVLTATQVAQPQHLYSLGGKTNSAMEASPKRIESQNVIFMSFNINLTSYWPNYE